MDANRIETEGRAQARAFLDTFRTNDLMAPRVRHERCGAGRESHCDGCGACPEDPHPSWCLGGTCTCGHSHADHKYVEWSYGRQGCKVRKCKCWAFDSLERERAYLEWCGSPDAHRAARAVKLAMIATASEPLTTFVDSFMPTLGDALAVTEVEPSDFR
jgi:hypothetical protein